MAAASALRPGLVAASLCHDFNSSSVVLAKSIPHHGSHSEGRRGSILDDPALSDEERASWIQYDNTTFFNANIGSKPAIYTHMTLNVVSNALLYPVALLTSSVSGGSRVYLPLQTLAIVTFFVSAIFYFIYSASGAPKELYPSSIYLSATWGLLCLYILHYIALITKLVLRSRDPRPIDDTKYHDRSSRSSQDSGREYGEEEALVYTGLIPSLESNPVLKRFANNISVSNFAGLVGSSANIVYALLNIPMLVCTFGYVLLGIATTFRMGMGHTVFSLLAHFIKGGVFFLLGFLELSRYMGFLAEYGMAWNTVPSPSSSSVFREAEPAKEFPVQGAEKPGFLHYLQFWPENSSMEFWQCLSIFIYGSSNIFLEHLGNDDGQWHHNDLQHVSIAFMFFGGGICGLVLESQTVHKLMAKAFSYSQTNEVRQRGFSINPLPALVIFWTGALMSQHHQKTELSTKIHTQWGALLSIAAIMRLWTYGLLLLHKGDHNNGEPLRPFTEVITSFCLICGGKIFMVSNHETVNALLYRQIDAMFVLNVGVGFTMLLMAYWILALAVRGLAAPKIQH